jgi:putative membrane protein
MWHMYEHHYWGMHFFWWLFWLILVLWLFSTRRKNLGQQTKEDSPLEILKKRFAKGEITKEEYEEIKNTLDKD